MNRWRVGTLALLPALLAVGCLFPLAVGPEPLVLPTDHHAQCVEPRITPQSVALPRTGGVTATLALDAFPPEARGCLGVKIATGNDVELLPATSARPAAEWQPIALVVADPPRPMLTISVGEAIENKSMFGGGIIVTGLTLKLPPELHFRDGTYYASLTSSSGVRRTSLIEFVAVSGEMRVAPLRGETGPLPFALPAQSSAVLALYPRGVRPPSPFEEPPDAVAGRTPTPLPTVPPFPPHQPPARGFFGNPPPDEGSYIGVATCGGPGICGHWERPVFQNGGNAVVDVPAGMSGTVSFSLALDYMGLQSFEAEGCPSEWTVGVRANGSGGTITFPPSRLSNSAHCVLRFTTVPRGRDGDGYEEDVVIRALDTGTLN